MLGLARAATGDALALRPDLEVLVVRDEHHGGGDERWRARLARSDASARPVDLVEAVALEPSHLLVEVVGAGPDELLVAEGTADAHRHARPARSGRVAGRGRRAGCCRPACSRRWCAPSATPEDHGLELLDVQVADRIAGPTGLVRPEQLGRRVDCPVAPELLRLS